MSSRGRGCTRRCSMLTRNVWPWARRSWRVLLWNGPTRISPPVQPHLAPGQWTGGLCFHMAKIDFHRNDRPTIGIELELGLLDAETLALTSAYGLLNARLTVDGHQNEECSNFKAELMQCVLEINTCICETVGEAEKDLRAKIAVVENACDALGL